MLFTEPTIVDPRVALPGRDAPVLRQPFFHRVFGHRIDRVPAGAEVAVVGLGCFWGAEKLFWETPGVVNTAAGYAGGFTPNPTYDEACSGRTGHTESVRVVYDPAVLSYEDILRIFFENHDPTQGFRQGNDRGTQYRSAIFPLNDDQLRRAEAVRDAFAPQFAAAGFGPITTEITPTDTFYYAEAVHQQYLDANPNGYCPVHATGVTCNPGA
ncbi:MAG: peptide-methionine (S)-S-oxide reductase MsrA [Micropruina sp.]|uniref:peptide-methionine (S)-S-oxide reductase MsrA n=1 Tax=Micropruina sp. TaxID=2737536 RepID=UPI0039E6BF05